MSDFTTAPIKTATTNTATIKTATIKAAKPIISAATALPNPYSPAMTAATLKREPQDFIVEELLTLDFEETGEHLWLHVQKTHLNTAYLAKLLAKWADIAAQDVGYSGLKDRHAVTSQWFSLRLPSKTLPEMPFVDYAKSYLNPDEKITILAEHWHSKKLQRGTHKLNHFSIILHEVAGDTAQIQQQLTQIREQGVPNYFGEQRFGQEDGNIQKALEYFATGRVNGRKQHPKFDRDKISFYISAARSELFNAILARRVQDGTWNSVLTGEVFNLAGSNSIFTLENPDFKYHDGEQNNSDNLKNPLSESQLAQTLAQEMVRVKQRLQAQDIHLTGAMWGAGELQSYAEVAALETAVIASQARYQQLAAGLVQQGVKQQRRPLRLIPANMSWQWLSADNVVNTSLQLTFDLPSGCFATSVIAMLLANALPKDIESV